MQIAGEMIKAPKMGWAKPLIAVGFGVSLFIAGPSQASLIGEQVTGVLYYDGDNVTNYYDPSNGFVPPGYGNSVSPSLVTIADPLVEFAYDDVTDNFVSADFSATQLTITDINLTESINWTQTFTFATPGVVTNITLVSDVFAPGLGYSIAGDTITITWAGNVGAGPGQTTTYTAVFDLSAETRAPEPMTLGLLGTGLFGLAMARRRSRRW